MPLEETFKRFAIRMMIIGAEDIRHAIILKWCVNSFDMRPIESYNTNPMTSSTFRQSIS